MDCSSNNESNLLAQLPTKMKLDNFIENLQTAEGGGGWETHRVRLRRVPGYGFGIAVSGGRDNPHFASGDPAIAVSDVLRAGPAEDKLQVNDRIVSANGVPLENVEYARAVQVLRDSGGAVSLVVRRRAPAAPALSAPRQTLKFSLSKAGKKEDFGVVLGCRLFIKELTPKARDQLNAAGQVLCEGDVITRINNTNCADAMSLKEAKKIIDSCKERLNLVVTRELVREATVPTVNNVNQGQNLYHNSFNSMGSEGLTPAYSGQNLYVAAPSRSTLLGDEPRLAGSVGGGGPGPGRRAPLSMGEVSQLDPQGLVGHPPRPPPPRQEDYYSSRKQLYEEDLANQRSKPVGSLEARLISFQKEGSVGLRLAGGNRAGVFVSAVQPGSPAALQGLAQADKILKVNDMEMKGVTREEAVLFLLSLQERIDLIVQHSPDEYNAVTSGQMVGDSFHIKCHFHYTDPIDGEMSFRCGDVFHVVDTLHNGTVGAWQVYRIGRSNQEVQKGIIPNKARAEELATAQFNATKKEMVSGTDSRTNFFRRRRSTHRRSKSLGKDHWDDVVFSDSISKFPAYERVVLKHPGFVRPVILFGAISDLAREKLLRDYPDKFSAPQMDNSNDEGGPKCTSGIIRLSGIRSVMDRGRHALLDITPNAVDRLNYAQFYPLVIFLKPDSKHTIKQLRQGLPKSAHKSSKKLLEQCQQLERTWGHVFTHTVTLNDTSGTSWYPKLTDLLHRSQQQQLWVSETKRSEPLSDDFLFPMSASTENRLSYASSPESDLDVSPPPHSPRLVKSSSDPSVATTQDNLDRDDEINNINTINNLSMMNDAVPPPYTSGYSDSKYGFSVTNGAPNNMGGGNPNQHNTQGPCLDVHGNAQYPRSPMAHSPPQSPLYGTVPELPPRMDRTPGAPGSGTPGSGAPSSGTPHKPAGGVLLPGPPPGSAGRSTLRHNPSTTRPSAQERLFGPPKEGVGGPGIEEGAYSERPTSIAGAPGSLDRHRHLNNTNSYDSMSSSYSYTNPAGPPSGPAPNPSGPLSPLPPAPSLLAISTNRLGPNAPDDLKVAPGKFDHTANPGPNTNSISPLRNSVHEHSSTNASLEYRTSDATAAYRDVYRAHRTPLPPANGAGAPRGTNPIQPNTDYSKYSSRADYVTSASNGGRPLSGSGAPGGGGGAPAYKPVPPPKPKHYRPPGNEERHHAKSYSMGNGNMDMLNGSSHQGVPNRNSGPTNGYGGGAGVYGGGGGGGISHTHSHSHPAPAPAQYQQPPIYSHHGVYGGAPPQSPPYNGPPQHHRPGPGPGAGAMNLPPNPHLIDLAGSREQRGSAFELYRKPQHMHSMSGNEDIGLMNANAENEANFTPKTKKKLSKKPSFIKNAVLDLFRSKANKSTNKVSRQQSLCENDLQHGGHRAPLRREKSDLSGMTNHIRNAQMRNQALNRSNSTCDKQPALKPILKRQSSFSDGRSGVTCTVRDYDATPIIKNLRRQSSMCDMETEPKVKTTLRRQNSLIDYGRRDISGLNGNFNMITQIDPIYQRQFEIKHEPFHPTQPLPPEPTYQRKEEVIYDPIPKPKRTFASTSFNQSTENPYSTQSDMSDMSMESSYVSQQQPFERKMTESPYSTRSECLQKNAYSLKTDPNYELKNEDRESLYATREQIQKQRKFHESPYSTKEEMLRQRFSESPYGTRESPYGTRESPYGTRESPYGTRESPYGTRESPYGTRENSYGTKGNLYGTRESPYGTRDNPSESPYTTKEALKKSMDMSRSTYTEGLYASKQEILRQNMPIMSTYPGRVSPVNKCISEPPYASKSEMLARSPESPYATRQEVRSCSESPYATRQEIINEKAGTSEKIYVSKQEILTMKAANKESPYATRAQMEDKFEIIRQRNQAKKEMIYQSRKDVAETRVREPIYVSKRELKDTVIYESHQEVKEHVQNNLENRDSPYELGDANHLVRRDPVYQTKAETLGLVGCAPFKEIDFASLRLTESQTDSEKQSKLKLERSVLRGEPVYQPRLHGKASHISNALKITGSPVPYESTTSMETQYISECSSINFDGKPHSTPYASQDLPENAQDRLPTFKSNRSVSFNDKILEKSPDTTVNSGDNTMNGNETTVINNETTVIENNKTSNIIDTENGNDTSKPVEPEAPNTTWGIFDSEGGLLEDRQWGVSLIIPPKAIAPGIKQKIYFTVSDPRHSTRVGGPPIDMDNGEAMLSPLVMCGPQGLVFLRPVTLRLPHCANAVPSLGLTIKATDTEAHLSTDWDNIHLPATTTLNTVAVKVDHF